MSIAVVGAGPAGSVAAVLLAQSGESVTLIDENQTSGGCLTYDRSIPGTATWMAELQSAVMISGAGWMSNTVAWAAFRRDGRLELALSDGVRERSLMVDHLVIAAGTTDRPWTGPGATLPGVLTARAVEILINRHGVAPAQRFAIIGTSADSDRIRSLLQKRGCEVAGTYDAGQITAIVGETGVQAVVLTDGSRIGVDTVVIACGEVPDTQLAGMLEMTRVYDLELAGWRVGASDSGDGVHVIGGALLGQASLAVVVQSAVIAVDAITGSGPGLLAAGLRLTSDLLTGAAIHS